MLPERLQAGYRAFLGERFPRERGRYEAIADRQRPEIMVIGCCDSRVAPEAIFDSSPGELFVLRNVANLVPPYTPDGEYHGTSAALEFAVQALKVRHIVVLGHAGCGGIHAFADEAEPLSPGDFIGKWTTLMAPAADRIGRGDGDVAAYSARLELAVIEQSLRNLMTFPCVKILAERGRLHLHGAHFGVATGALLVRDPATGLFHPALDGPPGRATFARCDEEPSTV